MKPRHKRFAFIGLGLLVLGVATVLILNAFQSNLVFFFTPTQVVSGASGSVGWLKTAVWSVKTTA
jgi:cytochrome c-type biogenesis protein CcmE